MATTPARSAPAYRLPPLPLFPLLGRDGDLRAALTLLTQPRLRALTIEGPGGVGKTSLALAVMADLPGDVAFADLSALRDPLGLPGAVASAVGLRISDEQHLNPALRTFLGDRALTLVLDNFEQVLGAADWLGDLLSGAPGLRALITSRQGLNRRWEQRYPLAPLPLPAEGGDTIALLENPAVALFILRARATEPLYAPESGQVRQIARLVRYLDGLPLAVELAAAHLAVMPPEAALDRMQRHLPLPEQGDPDRPERQRTLQATVAWSYGLLLPEHQRWLRHLSVFEGGWALNALGGLGPTSHDPLSVMVALAASHLITRVSTLDGHLRYRMAAAVREFGLHTLRANDDEESARQAHAEVTFAQLKTLGMGLRGTDQGQVLARLDQELDNLRAALDWAEQRGTLAEVADVLTLLGPYWFIVHPAEGWSRVNRALVAVTGSPRRAGLLDVAANLARLRGDLAAATGLGEEALALQEHSADRAGEAQALRNLGVTLRLSGDQERSVALHRQAETVYLALGDRAGALRASNGVAAALTQQGHYVGATALHRTNLRVADALGDRWLEAVVRTNLGLNLLEAATDRGGWAGAQTQLERGLDLGRQARDAPLTLAAVIGLGLARLRQGEAADAQRLLEEALDTARTLPDPWNETRALLGLAEHAVRSGGSAAPLFLEGLQRAARLGDHAQLAASLEGFAHLAQGLAALEDAAFFLAAAQEQRTLAGTPCPPAGRAALERLSAQVSAGDSGPAWTQGAQADVDSLHVRAAALAERSAQAGPATARATGGLSPREHEVLQLVAQGKTNKQIGRALGVSEHAARFHLTNILTKLGARNRAEASVIAGRRGLLSP